jgi:DNA helicase-2/ATP-dependent DNA helicase PcrA
MAVLVRTNAMTGGYEEALAAAGVPYQLRGTERFFERAEVRQALTLLRVAARSASAGSSPADAVRAVLTGLGLTRQPPGGRGKARERWESLEALAAVAEDFLAATPGSTLAELAAELELRSATGHAPDAGGVTVASLHAAKGMEWDAVFLPCLTEGVLPIVYAQTAEAIEEERRLLYVGITRARERLYLSWSLARSAGSRQPRTPSRFLDDLRGLGAGRRAGGGRRAAGRNTLLGPGTLTPRAGQPGRSRGVGA